MKVYQSQLATLTCLNLNCKIAERKNSPGSLRIKHPTKQPPNHTKPRINPKRPTWRCGIHQTQKRARNQHITTPIHGRADTRTDSSYFESEELSLLPGDVTETGCVARDIEEHGKENGDG